MIIKPYFRKKNLEKKEVTRDSYYMFCFKRNIVFYLGTMNCYNVSCPEMMIERSTKILCVCV